MSDLQPGNMMKAAVVILILAVALIGTTTPTLAVTKGLTSVTPFSCMTLIGNRYANLSVIAADSADEAIEAYVNSFNNRSRTSEVEHGRLVGIKLRTEEMLENAKYYDFDEDGYATVDEITCDPVKQD